MTPLKSKIMADKRENEMKELLSVDYVRGLLGNNSGKISFGLLKKNLLLKLSSVGIKKEDGGGAGICMPNVGIIFAYNSNNPTQYIVYMYIRNIGDFAIRIPLTSNELTLGAQNNQGTSVVNGADTQICLYIDKDSLP